MITFFVISPSGASVAVFSTCFIMFSRWRCVAFDKPDHADELQYRSHSQPSVPVGGPFCLLCVSPRRAPKYSASNSDVPIGARSRVRRPWPRRTYQHTRP